MTKVLDKAAALAAFHNSPRPTAESLEQWDTLDVDVGAGRQQVVRSILFKVVHAVQVELPAMVASGFAAFRHAEPVVAKQIRKVEPVRHQPSSNRMPHPCR